MSPVTTNQFCCSNRWKTLPSCTWWTLQKCLTSTRCTSCTTPAPSCSFLGKLLRVLHVIVCNLSLSHSPMSSLLSRNKHIMIDLGTGNNNKINWTMEDKQEMIDIVETVYRGARKGRGLVVSPKDYSTKYRYWFFSFADYFCSTLWHIWLSFLTSDMFSFIKFFHLFKPKRCFSWCSTINKASFVIKSDINGKMCCFKRALHNYVWGFHKNSH